MKECTFDRLDALISLGARSLVDKEAARFMQLSEDIEVSSRNRRRVEQTIRHRQNKEKMQNIIRPMKVAGIACLISVSLTFTACVSIPSVRVAMWNAIVEWYDEYISIRFVPGEGTDKLPEVPQTIEAINFPTYMPDGYSSMIMKTKNSVLVEYFDCDGEYAYSFTQRLYDNKYLTM